MSQSYRIYDRPHQIKNFTTPDWGSEHSVHYQFLPFDWSFVDPIKTLHHIHDIIEDLPETAKTIPPSMIEESLDTDLIGIMPKLVPLFEVAGSWAINTDIEGKTRFINPSYKHLSSLDDTHLATETDERLEVLDRVASYGVVEMKTLAPWFGVTYDSLKQYAKYHDFQWRERRSKGLKTMARTWRTMQAWGYSATEIGEAFRYEPQSVRSTIGKKVDEDFIPPEDPTKGFDRDPPNRADLC